MNSSTSETGECWDGSTSSSAMLPVSFKSCEAMMSLKSLSKLGKALLTACLFSSSSLRLGPWLLFLNLNRLPSSSSLSFSFSLKILHFSRKTFRIEFNARRILTSTKPCWIEWLRTRSRQSRRILREDIIKKNKKSVKKPRSSKSKSILLKMQTWKYSHKGMSR